MEHFVREIRAVAERSYAPLKLYYAINTTTENILLEICILRCHSFYVSIGEQRSRSRSTEGVVDAVRQILSQCGTLLSWEQVAFERKTQDNTWIAFSDKA